MPIAPIPILYITAMTWDVILKAWKSSLITRGHPSCGLEVTSSGQACVGSNEDEIVRFEHSVTLRVTSTPASVVISVPWQ